MSEEKIAPKARVLNRPRRPGELVTPLKAIRSKCLDCCCWVAAEVRQCPVRDCVLWPYRMGSGTRAKSAVESERAALVRENRA